MTQSAYAKGVGEWIVAQRAALGLSQADVALAVGVSQSSLSKWENGDIVLSSYSHAKLRAYFKQQKDLRGPVPEKEVSSR